MPNSPSARPSAPSSSAPRKGSRHKVLWVAAGVLALILVALVVLAQGNWNAMRPWVNDKVSEATGRHFAIEGDLRTDWTWPQPLVPGWQRWIPGLTVHAQQVVLGNRPDFGAVGALDNAEQRKSPPVYALQGEDASAAAQTPASGAQQAAKAKAAAAAETKDAPETPDSSKNTQTTSAVDAPASPPQITAQAAAAAAQAAPPMATVDQLSASLRLLPLLKRTISLRTVVFTTPDVALARLADGRNNWTFTPRHARPDSPNPWNVTLDQLQVHDAELAYADGVQQLALRVQADTLDPNAAASAAESDATGEPEKAGDTEKPGTPGTPGTPDMPDTRASSAPAAAGTALPEAPRYGVQFQVRGRYAQADIEGQGQAGDLLTLRAADIDYPVQFSARAGDTQARVRGTLSNPLALDGMDLQVSLQGASMADLYDLSGLVLPSTPAYATHGRLVGSLEPGRARWEYKDFDGQLGKSDLHGSLIYTSGKPRPSLKGSVHSNQLRLADLGPALGTPDGAPAKKAPKPGPGKVLPVQVFATDRWNAMDLDVQFEGRKIIGSDSLPIDNLDFHAVMDNARLTLQPLRFGVAKGKINAQVELDSRKKPLQAQVRATVEGLQLSSLFPKVDLMKKSLGRMDGALALRGRGDSVAAMLGSSNGESRLYVRDGTLSSQLLDLAALNVGSIVVAKLFGDDKEVQLRCAIADFSFKDGIAQTRSAKLSTEEAIVEAVGTIDLEHEHIDLRIKPESLEWKFLSLRTPLYVRGPFAKPDVGIEPGPLLLRAAAAAAAAAVAPAALALVPITVPAADDDERCARLMAQANAAVKAGPAGAGARPAPRSNAGTDKGAANARARTGKEQAAPAAQPQQSSPAQTPAPSGARSTGKLSDNPLYRSP